MNTAAITEQQRQTRMLRRLRAGSRVKATKSASTASQGAVGTVIEPNPFQPDGVRRVKVRWDGWAIPISLVSASIEEAD